MKRAKEERRSFLKKRTKKLLLTKFLARNDPIAKLTKSFLLLFFKKEGLAYGLDHALLQSALSRGIGAMRNMA